MIKSINFLGAFELNEFAFKEFDCGNSSFELAYKAMSNFPFCDKVIVLADETTSKTIKAKYNQNFEFALINDFSAKSVFNTMSEYSGEFDAVFFSFADAPFLDNDLTEELFEQHRHFKAEYSFVDGYPEGFAPEILTKGLLSILSGLSEIDDVRKVRNFIFETVKKDINSFDIETLIAPDDLRHLRLQFYANTKRQFNLCNNMLGIKADNYAEFINAHRDCLFTLPGYYAIEISRQKLLQSCYLPANDEKANSINVMQKESVFKIIDKISSYSDDAVISLSIFGEPVLHSNLEEIIEYVLSFERLSLLIETTGLDWTENRISQIEKIVKNAKPRKNGHAPIYWIVKLDAISSTQYGAIHGLSNDRADVKLKQASEFTETLYKLFGAVVYPQFIRMNENEEELESFYRNWKERVENVLIQKYDHFCTKMQDRKVADLSPLLRHPCWHLKRDMYIFSDGSIPLCREDISLTTVLGNALTDDFDTIRNRAFPIYRQQLDTNYKGLCEYCDEYYTYNF
ncbi:MAG: spiro-SPASM protein [Treponema sp.]|nr:MAG: spiro-SPASM protein [Treponema sp.]